MTHYRVGVIDCSTGREVYSADAATDTPDGAVRAIAARLAANEPTTQPIPKIRFQRDTVTGKPVVRPAWVYTPTEQVPRVRDGMIGHALSVPVIPKRNGKSRHRKVRG